MATLFIVNNLHNGALCTLIERVHRLHVLCIEFKVVHIGIVLDPAWRVALGQRHPVLLQTIPNEHLAGRLLVLVGQRDERLVLGLLIAHDRTVGLHHHALLLAVGHALALLAPCVELFRPSVSIISIARSSSHTPQSG